MFNRAAPGCNEKTHQQGEESNIPKYRKPTGGQEPKEALIVRLPKARTHQTVEVEKNVEEIHSVNKVFFPNSALSQKTPDGKLKSTYLHI